MTTWQRIAIIPVTLATLAVFTNFAETAVAQGAAAPQKRSLGPIIEVEVPDDSSLDAAWLLDLDSGRLFKPPQDVLKRGDLAAFKKWLDDHGIDAFGEGDNDGLVGVGIIARLVDGPIAEKFPDPPESSTVSMIDQMVALGDPGSPITMDAGRGVGPRATYLFKTREGAAGVLQIIGWHEDGGAVGVRYRLLETVEKPSAAAAPTAQSATPSSQSKSPDFTDVQSATLHALSDSKTNICMIDFDTGQLFTHVNAETATAAGIDAYPKPHPVHHTLKGKDVSVVRVPAAIWSDLAAAQAGLKLLSPTAARDYVDMPANPPTAPPATYLFKTAKGSLGMMRILKVDDDANTVDIEYRLQTSPKSPPRLNPEP